MVVGGPSGSGKTAIGRALAALLEVPFLDADDLHPPDNVAKTSRFRCVAAGDEPEGTMMALAGLGDPDHYRADLRSLIHLGDNGELRIAPGWGRYDLTRLASGMDARGAARPASAVPPQERADLALPRGSCSRTPSST